MSVRDLTILGCSSQHPTRLRNHGAYLLRWNEEGFLFDPGEGTQRQFIFAEIAPPTVTRILISHFHGDHCLGLGSMLMRLNLDRVNHPIHCYYPASGKKYFDRLRYGTIYHEAIEVIEHPIKEGGVVHDDGKFKIEAQFLKHGVDNVGYRITEADTRKYDKEKLKKLGIQGERMRAFVKDEKITIGDKTIQLDDVSWIRKGDTFASVIDTRICPAAVEIARNAKMLLCEATYLEEHRELAHNYFHMTAKQAAQISKDANVEQLIMTHFSARYRDIEPFEKQAREIFPNAFAADDFKRFPFPR
ncbi:MAG: ribonuclease Z [Candidatus Algichlamydia australiensis]|nr:ribonuclease Z [Chlamydiales bacterium]